MANNLQRLDLKYKEKKLVQDLAEQVARTTTIKNQGDLHAATIKIQDSIKQLNEALANKHTQDATLAMLEVGSFDKRLQSALKLQGAQIREANAHAFEAGQHGNLLKVQKLGQEFTNSVLKIDSDLASRTAQMKLDSLESELRRHKFESDKDRAKAEVELRKLRERIIHYNKYDNAASFDDFWDNFPIIGGIVRGLAK